MAMKKAVFATVLMIGALSQGAAQNTSSVLQALPVEVQKNIEEIRAGCREYLKNVDDGTTGDNFSGDYGLEQFTLSGVPAVMLNNLKLHGCER